MASELDIDSKILMSACKDLLHTKAEQTRPSATYPAISSAISQGNKGSC